LIKARNVETVRFDIFSIFPSMFDGFLTESILKRAQDRGIVEIVVHDIREWATDRHRSVDDYPYGGGAGMVMMAPPIVNAVEASMPVGEVGVEILILSASGERFDQAMARDLTSVRNVGLICGRYEGIDQRVADILGAREVSIGDFVLTGGELPAAVIVDAVARLLPGVIQEASTEMESYTDGLLEHPHYTRPYSFRGLTPPDVLLSGHHANVEEWRRLESMKRTSERRPDLASAPADTGGPPVEEPKSTRAEDRKRRHES
jgi:tRNA (guanine37-N1)-methyltransferase